VGYRGQGTSIDPGRTGKCSNLFQVLPQGGRD
jgi:hypothetical protein